MKHKSLSKSATTPPLLILLISAIVLIVSACGGGGGGGGGGTPAASTDNNPLPNTGNNPPTVNRLAPIANLNSFTEKEVVRGVNPNDEDFLTTSISGVGTPTTGSSNAGRARFVTSNLNVITFTGRSDAFVFQSSSSALVSSVFTNEDTIEIGIENLGIPLRAGTSAPFQTKTTSSFAVTFPVSGSSATRNYRGYEISETDLVFGLTEHKTVPVAEALVFTTRSETANDDTDYVTFGVWLIDRADATPNSPNPPIEVAAFASGGDTLTPTAYLRPSRAVTATYTGDAIMMTGYTGRAADSTRAPNSIAHGELSLTATFRVDPTISGEISEIGTIGTNSDTPLPSTLTLGSADISIRDVAGGFFTGEVRDGTTDIGDWGGQFYGDEAEVVSGTFNVDVNVPALTTPALAAGRLSIIGAFGAEKE